MRCSLLVLAVTLLVAALACATPKPDVQPGTTAGAEQELALPSGATFKAAIDWAAGLDEGGVVLQAGDADQDLDFDQLDLVQVQVAAKYLTGQPATWGEGDWDGSGMFDSSDMVAAFADGGYEKGPQPPAVAVPEPTSGILLLGSLIFIATCRRRIDP